MNKEIALTYAAQGYAVFPLHTPRADHSCDCGSVDCTSIGKHPRIANGLKSATTNPITIEAWWSRFPDANIGLRTGAISDIVVVDVDRGEGKSGAASLAILEAKHGPLPATLRARTGSGGLHIFFRHPRGVEIPNTAGKLGPNLDTRGDGGYVVAAPSRHASGGEYAWENDLPLAPLPAWVLAMIVGKKDVRLDIEGDVIPIGQRDVILTKYAGKLRRAGLSPEAILAALTTINATQCQEPLPEADLARIAQSIGRKEAGPTPAPDPLIDARALIDALKPLEVSAALEAALQPPTLGALALVCDHDLGFLESFLLGLEHHGAKSKDVARVTRAVHGEMRKARKLRLVDEGPPDAVLVNTVLQNAPLPATAVVPHGWGLSPYAVTKKVETSDGNGGKATKVETIAPTAIVISGRLSNISGGTELVRLSFLRDNAWHHHIVARTVVAAAREIVSLAGVGLPVTSSTAGDVVDYIAAFEAANIEVLPKANVTRQMGWQGDEGSKGFLWGHTLLREGDEADIRIEELDPVDWKPDHVSFYGESDGEEQLADGYTACGTFEAWHAAVTPLKDHPRPLLALYAGLSPPLLMILRTHNFMVDFAHITSSGKTTGLRAAASCWGNPDENAAAAAITTWDATRVWFERAASILNCLPLILDDTKRAKKPEMVAQTIYDVAQGSGKGRGSVTGLRKTMKWQTVLLSSGEAKATSFSGDGGTHARVVSVWGQPFGFQNAAMAKVVVGVNSGVLANYGHAGPRLVRFCLAHRADWDLWREAYETARNDYLAIAENNPVAGRLAEHFAVIQVTAIVAHAALGLAWDYQDPIQHLIGDLFEQLDDTDRPRAAMKLACDWAEGNQHAFSGRTKSGLGGDITPPGGLVGIWSGEASWLYIGFYEHSLAKILTEHRFDPESTFRIWLERGWLKTTPARRGYRYQIERNGAKSDVIALTRRTFENRGAPKLGKEAAE